MTKQRKGCIIRKMGVGRVILDPTIKARRGGRPRTVSEANILSPGRMVREFLQHRGKPSVTKSLNAYLSDHPEKLLAIARAMVNKAIEGNIPAAQEVMNRIDGKVAEVHRIDAENPVMLIFAPVSQMLAKVEAQVLQVSEGVGLGKEVVPEIVGEPDESKVVSLAPSLEEL